MSDFVTKIKVRGEEYDIRDAGAARIDSPEFTGIPLAPTADADTDSPQIATTAFVQRAVKDKLGEPGGIATLDENGKVPTSQLPSYVDDVLDGTYDEANNRFLTPDGGVYTPESGKIYIDTNTRVTYRWSGSVYVEIASSLKLGTTAETAFPGDRGLALEQEVSKLGMGAIFLQGSIGTDGDVTELPPRYEKGEMYQVVTAGKYAGKKCEVGDFIVAVKSNLVSLASIPEIDETSEYLIIKTVNPQTGEIIDITFCEITRPSGYAKYGSYLNTFPNSFYNLGGGYLITTTNNGITWKKSYYYFESLSVYGANETTQYEFLYSSIPIYDDEGKIKFSANPYTDNSMDAFNADWAVIQGNIEDLVSEGAIYIDPEEETPDIGDIEDVTSAKFVSYNNTTSGIEATNVQEAIDEIKELVSDSSVPEGTAYIDFNESSTDIPGSAENVTSATLVSYDNSTSGLEASNVQEAVDKVSFRTEWKLAGHFAGSGHIAPLPTSFDELYIAITDSYSSRTFTVNVLRHHIETMIDEYNIEYLATFGFATSLDSQTGWYAGGCLKITKTTINLLDYSFRGTDHSDDVKWLVYYR